MAELHVHVYVIDDRDERPIEFLHDQRIDFDPLARPLVAAELLYAVLRDAQWPIRKQATQLHLQLLDREVGA